MRLRRLVGGGELRAKVPGAVSLIGFPEMKRGVLRTKSAGQGDFADTAEIFCKEIDLVLTLVE